jgi:type I restriction enzyme S subunit
MKNVSQGNLRSIKVRLPSLDQQAVIARVGESFAVLLRATAVLIDSKRAFKRALLRELLTGLRRLPACAGGSWKTSTLGELFAERNEVAAESERLLSVTGDRGVIPRDELDRRDTSSADKSKYKRVRPGDIAYNTMRMWQGVSGIVRHPGIVSPAYTILVARGPLSPEYAKHLFKHPQLVHTFWRYSQGLVDDTLSLKYPNFARIPVTYPASIEEQNRIACVLDSADQAIVLLEQLRAAYDARKRAVMDRLLSGDLSLRAPADTPESAHA